MKTNLTSNWFLDAVLFSGFITAFFLDLTGLELHQWIGVGAAVLAAYHLIAHSNWVSAVTRRFFGKISPRARLYYLLDASLLIGFLTISFTGLMISSWFDLPFDNAASWVEVHILAAIVTLVIAAIKIGLHWRWVWAVPKKAFTRPVASLRYPTAAAPVAGGRQVSRRGFLQAMGVVSLASVFAACKALEGLQFLGNETTGNNSQIRTNSSETSNQEISSQSGTVQCSRRCSFPGSCHHYVDINGNNRCDFGECS